MIDFMNTLAGREFAAHIKTIANNMNKKEDKEEKLAAQIYSQLVVSEFNRPDGLSYEDMEFKAREAAKFFYKKN